ncbi:MAG: helix-turn-helix transcriptional regulator [Candidatus Azobacteroides sp.]|nr:helix-turn-helix transcriptional regulator [Candidatus Azobacteroides sp.]
MDYSFSYPSGELAPYVKKYWGMENYDFKESYSYRTVPSGLPELIFYFGNKPVSLDKDIPIEDNMLLCGHKSSFLDLEFSAGFSVFSVLFRPEGLKAFFDLPATEFYNKNIPLRFLLKNDANQLEDQLAASHSFHEKVLLIESFLYKLLHKKENKKDNLKRIHHSIELLTRTGGNSSVNALASSSCLSRKQYERIFSSTVGISPKQFARVARFQHALARKALQKSESLTALAYDCGYYDQSHMIHEFKALTGYTPSEYFSFGKPESDLYL